MQRNVSRCQATVNCAEHSRTRLIKISKRTKIKNINQYFFKDAGHFASLDNNSIGGVGFAVVRELEGADKALGAR